MPTVLPLTYYIVIVDYLHGFTSHESISTYIMLQKMLQTFFSSFFANYLKCMRFQGNWSMSALHCTNLYCSYVEPCNLAVKTQWAYLKCLVHLNIYYTFPGTIFLRICRDAVRSWLRSMPFQGPKKSRFSEPVFVNV